MYTCRNTYTVDKKTFLYHTMLWPPPAHTGLDQYSDMLQGYLGDGQGSTSNEPIHFDKLAIGPGAPVGGDVASSSQHGPVLHVEGDAMVSGIIKAQQFIPLSDERAKCNIHAPDHDALSRLQEIKSCWYNFNSSPEGRRLLGPLAQQLAKVFPDVVETDPNGDKRVDFTSLTSLTVQAVQQLGAQMQTYQQNTDKCLGFVFLVLGSLAKQLESKAYPIFDTHGIASLPVSASSGQASSGAGAKLATANDSSPLQFDKTAQQPTGTTDPTSAAGCNPDPSEGSQAHLPAFKDKDEMVKNMLDALGETNAGVHQMVLNRLGDFGDQSVWDSFQEALPHGSMGKRTFIQSLKKKRQDLKTRSATAPFCFCSPPACAGLSSFVLLYRCSRVCCGLSRWISLLH